MTRVRLGAVGYLNARPLVYGLERQARFEIRFDPPSVCAALLHEGAVDLGLIPAIEYHARPDYHVVPDVAIASEGAVASVALFTSRPVTGVRTIAADSSSRTSVALLRVLCACRFGIRPDVVTMPPDFGSMLGRADAALVIGDPALFCDEHALGLEKIDLGAEWTAMTGLPFVWAFWAGRADAVGPEEVAALQAARDAGVVAAEAVARAYAPDDPARASRGARYLRENIRFGLSGREVEGLRRFYAEASALALVPRIEPLRWYGRS
jgi:predicted solute-binding protein